MIVGLKTMEMNKMYSAYDNQTGDYFHTGRNSLTKQECEDQIITHLIEGSWAEPEDQSIMKTCPHTENLEFFGVEIHEHQQAITQGEY